MRAFMLGTLIMTFLSGVTSGYLVGNSTAVATPPLTWIDQDLQMLKRTIPEVSAKDLALARAIYEDHGRQVMELKSEAEALLGDQLLALEKQTEQKIRGIISSYDPPSSGSK